MISFDNTNIAFRSKSSRDLKRTYRLFKLVSNPKAVKFGQWFTKLALNFHLPIKWIIKKTIFKQFCGGESITESLTVVVKLADYGVGTILDYSVEGKIKEEDFDRTVNEIIATIKVANTNPNIPFAVFKITGICLFGVLESTNESCKHLEPELQDKYDKLLERVNRICCAAYENNVPLFIDAEETWIQNTIDRIVKQMSIKYNKHKAIIFNTIQLYRHDKLKFLNTEINDAKMGGYFLGMKLVRGAYMEKERKRAQLMGYPSPIQANKELCDKDFDSGLRIVLENIEHVALCSGTHNEMSSKKLVELMKELNIQKHDSRIYFAQLYGMSDHISFNLADKNYNVAKYVPYGPIKEVVPYLIRRAEENTSVAGQTSRELTLIMKERKRRRL
jgi:proline dehydrogenase